MNRSTLCKFLSMTAVLGAVHAPAEAGDPIDGSRASLAAAGFAGSVVVTGSVVALTLAGTAALRRAG